MAEIGFRNQSNAAAAAATASSTGSRGILSGRRRDLSPDSVILTLESNFSLFSSASASVSRCSFTSEAHDRDSLSSDFSQTVSGHERGGCSAVGRSFSGPDLNLSHSNKLTVFHSANGHHDLDCKKVEKASKVQKQQDNSVLRGDDETDGPLALDSARNSFSQALRECQERRKTRSELLTKKLERRRPASLDLNNAIPNVLSSSPRFGVMKKSMMVSSSRKSGNFPSPGTPSYHNGGNLTVNRGWSSERVPSLTGTNSSRRQVGGGSTLLPYNNSGRTLPSKWEDAERWIFSPVSGDASMRSSFQQQHSIRKPKSKSGPLGPPGGACYSICSPTAPMYGGNGGGNHFAAASPFSAGLIIGDGLVARYGGGKDAAGLADRAAAPAIARCASVHGCTDLICQSPGTNSRDEKVETEGDAANKEGTIVSRKDVATQMSPEESCPSSPRRKSSFSQSTTSIVPVVDVQGSSSSSKPDVRDVQVDERVTVTRWSKKNKSGVPAKVLDDVDDWKLEAVESCPVTTWDASSTKSSARATREEAKIIAWENLQKAKAEAAIRKLEMKLEKKRSSSMDKIMNKLKYAQKKAQEMRSSVTTNKQEQLPKIPSFKSLSFRRGRQQVGSISGCFTCPAF